MELGKKIIEIRKQNNMTQENLAEKVHVTRQTISSWENGKSYPDIETLVYISNEFNVSLDMMLKGDNDMVREITKEQRQGKKQKKIIIITIVLAIIIVIGAAIFLSNMSTELSTNDYNITVKEITLDNVTIDKVNKIATHKYPGGVQHFKGEDYSKLMEYGKAYEIIVTSEKKIDGWYLADHINGNALDISIYHQISNLFKSKEHSKVIGVWFEKFDEIYAGDIVVWKK